MNLSLAGTNLWQAGNTVDEFTITPQGSVGVNVLNNTDALSMIIGEGVSNIMDQQYADILKQTYANKVNASQNQHNVFTAAISDLNPLSTEFAAAYDDEFKCRTVRNYYSQYTRICEGATTRSFGTCLKILATRLDSSRDDIVSKFDVEVAGVTLQDALLQRLLARTPDRKDEFLLLLAQCFERHVGPYDEWTVHIWILALTEIDYDYSKHNAVCLFENDSLFRPAAELGAQLDLSLFYGIHYNNFSISYNNFSLHAQRSRTAGVLTQSQFHTLQRGRPLAAPALAQQPHIFR